MGRALNKSRRALVALAGTAVLCGSMAAASPAQAQSSGLEPLAWSELVTVTEAAANKTAWGQTLELTGHVNADGSGSIWAGYGDWDRNTGPIARIEVDPVTGTYSNYGNTDTERLTWVSAAGEVLGIQWDSKHNYWLNNGNSGAVYTNDPDHWRISGFKAVHVLDVDAAQTSQGLAIWAVGSGSDTDVRETEKTGAGLLWKSVGKGDFERIMVADEDKDPNAIERLYWVEELDGVVYVGGHLVGDRYIGETLYHKYAPHHWQVDPVTNKASKKKLNPCGGTVPIGWNGALWCGQTRWDPQAKKDAVTRTGVNVTHVGDDGALYGYGTVNGVSTLKRNAGDGWLDYAQDTSFNPQVTLDGKVYAVSGSTIMVADLPDFGSLPTPDPSLPSGTPSAWSAELAVNTSPAVEGQPYIESVSPGIVRANAGTQRFELTGRGLDAAAAVHYTRDANSPFGRYTATVVERSDTRMVVEVNTKGWKAPSKSTTHAWGGFSASPAGVSSTPTVHGYVLTDYSFFDAPKGGGNNGGGNNGKGKG